MAEVWLVPKPCPRCSCQLRANFTCGCGACADDYCVNCGRFASLSDAEHTELSPLDERCSHGAQPHEHPDEAKAARVQQWFTEMLAKSGGETLGGDA